LIALPIVQYEMLRLVGNMTLSQYSIQLPGISVLSMALSDGGGNTRQNGLWSMLHCKQQVSSHFPMEILRIKEVTTAVSS